MVASSGQAEDEQEVRTEGAGEGEGGFMGQEAAPRFGTDDGFYWEGHLGKRKPASMGPTDGSCPQGSRGSRGVMGWLQQDRTSQALLLRNKAGQAARTTALTGLLLIFRPRWAAHHWMRVRPQAGPVSGQSCKETEALACPTSQTLGIVSGLVKPGRFGLNWFQSFGWLSSPRPLITRWQPTPALKPSAHNERIKRPVILHASCFSVTVR
jgi:hypothetical protein